eukprot:3620134-Rhodomonas_salina.1
MDCANDGEHEDERLQAVDAIKHVVTCSSFPRRVSWFLIVHDKRGVLRRVDRELGSKVRQRVWTCALPHALAVADAQPERVCAQDRGRGAADVGGGEHARARVPLQEEPLPQKVLRVLPVSTRRLLAASF